MIKRWICPHVWVDFFQLNQTQREREREREATRKLCLSRSLALSLLGELFYCPLGIYLALLLYTHYQAYRR